MVRGDCLFAATGVTDGSMLNGVKFGKRRDRDRDRGDALGHRHGALDQRRAPPAREIPSGLSAAVRARCASCYRDIIISAGCCSHERAECEPLWSGY